MTPDHPRAGTVIRRLATLIFDPVVMDGVVDPTLADMQRDIATASGALDHARARLMGYVAFWKLVVLAPFIFQGWPTRPIARAGFHVSLTILSLLAVVVSAVYGSTRVILFFHQIATTGSGGIASMAGTVNAAAIPALVALAVIFATAILAGVSSLRRGTQSAELPPMKVGATLTVVVVLVGALVAADNLLSLQTQALDLLLALTSPSRAARAGGGRALAMSAGMLVPMLVSSLIFLVLVVAGVAVVWRLTRRRRPSAALIWLWRAGLVAICVTSVWRGHQIRTDWSSFYTELAAVQSAPRQGSVGR